MNLRTLKKLSKRAAPLLIALGDDRRQFRARRWESHTGLLIFARKHFERSRSVHGDVLRQGEIKYPAKDGKGWICAWPPDHPRKGTIMVGFVGGYYEPEWEEETAWGALDSLVRDHYVDWDLMEDESYHGGCLTRDLSTPSKVLAAAQDMIAGKGGGG